MKRIDINKRTLRALYPPMDGRFERNMRAMIDTLPRRREKRRPAVKPRLTLAFALLLALVAVTALAAYFVTDGFFAEVSKLHVNAGSYDNWTLEEKEGLLASMKEYGVISDCAAWDEALAIRSAQKREEALDALFAGRYGIDGRTDVITAQSIIDHELGMYDSEWSLEEKAAYSQMMLELDLMGYDENIDLLPEVGVISQEEAVRIAKAAVTEAYGLEAGALDAHDVALYYQVHRSELGVKPPRYMVEMTGSEKTPYWVYVSGDGRVLGEKDGYKGVTSPAEEAARQRAEAQAQTVPMTARFAEHVAQLELLDTQIYTREGRIADGVRGLKNGTAVVYGRMSSAYTVYEGTFIECMSGDGQTKWKLEFADENGESISPEAVMELEDGDLLMIIRRQKSGKERQSIEYMRYDQLRIAADGTLRERRRLQTISELTGMRNGSFEQMFAMPGHGGMLVSGYMGGKNIPAYAQLDEHGEVRFTWSFEELPGYAAYLKTTDEGYVLCAWNEAANRTMLRFYDRKGQLVREGEDDPAMEGVRINKVISAGNGDLVVTSNFMENGKWLLARLDSSGRLKDKQIHEDTSGPILAPTEIVQIGGRYVYAANHHLSESDWTNHTGVIISDADGSIREYSMQGANDFADRIGYLHLAPIADGKALLAYTTVNGQGKLTVQLAVVTIPR